MSGFLLGFHLQALLFVLQPLAVVAFERNALATVQFQDPAGYVVQEVTVVGDGNHGAVVIVQEALQPGYGFGIQVVGGLVQQQHVRAGQQQAAQGHTATLTTRQYFHLLVPGRQAKGVCSDFHLAFDIVAVGGLDDRFQLALFLGQLVKVGIRLGVGGVYLVQFSQGVVNMGDRLVHDFLYGLLFVQLRLLGQVAHIDSGLGPGFADVVLVHTRHDTQQGRLTCTVQTQHANLGAREEAQGNVFKNLPLGRNHLAHAVHAKYVLGHVG